MLERKPLTDKIFLLGIDGLDPRLTKKYVAEGKMPNIKKFIERGSAREDLVMLGGHPTVTPPMWTTLATGCYSNVHGITGFYRASDQGLDVIEYNMDSTNCKAEQLWNVFAEAGKKTLVWHWPGSSWPPSSDNPNLHVVDGSSPGSVSMGGGQVETEFIVGANADVKELIFLPKAASDAAAPCAITGLVLDEDDEQIDVLAATRSKEVRALILGGSEGLGGSVDVTLDIVQSPIKEATGWANAPEGAKEFTILLSSGRLRRPGLILKNADGIYDQVAIYKSKKDEKPIGVITKGKFARDIVDEGFRDEDKIMVNRNMNILELAEDGSNLRMYISAAMDIAYDTTWHPKTLHKTIVENVGYPPPTSMVSGQDRELINNCMLNNWYASVEWQTDALNYLIENEGYDVIFSHFHNVDLQSHMFVRYMSDKGLNKLPAEEYQKFMEDVYIQTDQYIGKFLHLLDKGWTVLIFSDHAQVCAANEFPMIGDALGINIRVMEELGLTALKKDENGKELREIDWENTYAVAQRECHIYLNLKGREKHGIIDPKDKYEWEEEIMTRLYGYKDKKTGKRIIALALRNKDAVLLGMGGPECGDIIYFTAEGYNLDHADSLSTTWGDADTSVSPIFIGAGPGIKEGFTTERIIRQIDFAATVAVLGGVRMPAQCEGAPIYQILTKEY